MEEKLNLQELRKISNRLIRGQYLLWQSDVYHLGKNRDSEIVEHLRGGVNQVEYFIMHCNFLDKETQTDYLNTGHKFTELINRSMDDIDRTTFTDFLIFLFSKDKKLDLTWLIRLELTYINKANYGVNSEIREISRIYMQYDDESSEKKSLQQQETSLKTDLEFLEARKELLQSILKDDIKVKEEKIKIYIMQNPILNFFISNQNIGQYVDAALQQFPEPIIKIIADYARLIEEIPGDNSPEPKKRKIETSLSFNRRKSKRSR
jgi:hypothetical protein